MTELAKRYNTGKVRLELLPSGPLEKVADVYTIGAHKYSVYEDEHERQVLGMDIPIEDVVRKKLRLVEDGANNWRKGLPWMSASASVMRHIEAFRKGEDFDPELKTHHLANAAWGLLALLEFYETHPEMDNRPHSYLSAPKIGLDIDEVLCDFIGGLMERFPQDIKQRPVYWNDYAVSKCFDRIKSDHGFWANLKPKINPLELPFEPHCYISSRTIDISVTEKWLADNGFPQAPVYTVGHGASKVMVAKESGINWFVDDNYKNFIELNKNGISCFLMDAPHNQKYEVGHKRIVSLKELV